MDVTNTLNNLRIRPRCFLSLQLQERNGTKRNDPDNGHAKVTYDNANIYQRMAVTVTSHVYCWVYRPLPTDLVHLRRSIIHHLHRDLLSSWLMPLMSQFTPSPNSPAAVERLTSRPVDSLHVELEEVSAARQTLRQLRVESVSSQLTAHSSQSPRNRRRRCKK